jgi:hypothetical protein
MARKTRIREEEFSYNISVIRVIRGQEILFYPSNIHWHWQEQNYKMDFVASGIIVASIWRFFDLWGG